MKHQKILSRELLRLVALSELVVLCSCQDGSSSTGDMRLAQHEGEELPAQREAGASAWNGNGDDASAVDSHEPSYPIVEPTQAEDLSDPVVPQSNDASIESEDASSANSPVETDSMQAAVPDTLAVSCECEESDDVYTPPDLCEWIAVGDVTAVATVERLDLPNDLVWGEPPDAPNGRWLRDGEWWAANPALTIDLRVEHLLYGEAPERVSVRVGWAQVDQFAPMPTEKDPETGEVIWTSVAGRKGWEHRGPLRLGQRIVLGFSEVQVEREGVTTQYWSLLGNTILGTDAEERIRVYERQGDQKYNLAPVRLDRVTVTEALELVKDCPDDLLQSGRDRGAELRKAWTYSVTASVAAAGFVNQPMNVVDAPANPAQDEIIGWGVYVDPVNGRETKVIEQRIDFETNSSDVIQLSPQLP